MFRGYRNSKTSSIGTILVAGMIFLILGVVILLRENLQKYEFDYRSNLRLEIYLRDETTPDELHALMTTIRSLDGFRSFDYREKTEAYTQMQQSLGTQLLPEGGLNPFPNSISVSFDNSFSNSQNLARAEITLRDTHCVEAINYGKETLVAQEQVISLFERLASIVELLCLSAGILITYWSIRKMTLLRQKEIWILKSFGAGWKQIGVPLLVEGATLGFAAAVVGSIMLYLFWYFLQELPTKLIFVSNAGLMNTCLTGLLAGALGSLLVARSQLR